jgi:hypothetical protein
LQNELKMNAGNTEISLLRERRVPEISRFREARVYVGFIAAASVGRTY